MSTTLLPLYRFQVRLAAAALFLSPFVATAQPTLTARGEARRELLRQRESNFVQSAGQYLAGQSALAERTLLAVSIHKAGSAEWHHDAGVQFYGMAVYLRSRQAERTARALIGQALQELDLAVTLCTAKGDSAGAAAAHQQVAAIYDNFHGDPSAALVRLKEALRLNPSGKNLDREVKRLTRVEDRIAAKNPGK